MSLTFTALAFAAVAAPPQATTLTLKPVPSGAMRRMGGYSPQRLALSATAPTGLKKPPAGLKSPRYGSLKLGTGEVLVIVDRPTSKESRLFVDTNRNGDLTDDPAPQWAMAPYKDGETEFARFVGSANVRLPLAGQAVDASLGVYQFDPADTKRAALKDVLLYYTDYALEGTASLGGKTYPVLLTDDYARGSFQPQEGPRSGVRLLIDRNGDGEFDRRFESYDISKPFNLGGVSYQAKVSGGDGRTVVIGRSATEVAEIVPPPNLAIGQKAPTFSGKTFDGTTVSFPNDYKGKIVLVDFWATWCGPCIEELPNVKAAYKQFKDSGFDIVGISLDKEGDGPKLTEFAQKNEMPWRHIFDGKYWQAAVAKQYGVDSIPFVLLVDGDTGEILANAKTLRGPQITETVRAALVKKGLIQEK